jgi:maltose-binding protein MalE
MAKKKYIETPEKMWELFEAYRKDVKENPRYVYDYVGKDGTQVMKPLERPLTIEGFKNYCFEEMGDITAYLVNRDERYSQYSTICSRIKEQIRQDQIEGGMVGQYNPSITQRLNGLTEKTENKNTNVNKFDFDE